MKKPRRRVLVAGAAAAGLVAAGAATAVAVPAGSSPVTAGQHWTAARAHAALTDAGKYIVYVAQPDNSEVRTYDSPADVPDAAIATSDGTGVAVSPDGQTEYVSQTAAWQVTAISYLTGKQTSIPVGYFPGAIAVSPSGSYVYVALTGGDTGQGGSESVAVINPATDSVSTDIKVGAAPEQIVFSPDSSRAYVTTARGIAVIDTATSALLRVIPDTGRPEGAQGIAISQDGTMLFVTNPDAGTLLEISTATGRVVGTTRAGEEPYAVAASPDGTTLYVADTNSDSVAVISARTGRITGNIPVGQSPQGIGITPDGSQVWVANGITGSMSVISTATRTVTDTIAGSDAWAGQGLEMAFGPDPRHVLYNFDDGTTDGWQAGQNVTSVSNVTTIANNPQTCASGGCLQAAMAAVLPTAPHSDYVAPAQPIDMSGDAALVLEFDCYGSVPGVSESSGYVVTVTLTSTDGTTLAQTFNTSADAWSSLSVSLAGWSGASAVSQIEVEMHTMATTYGAWGADFQLDNISLIAS